ncbi:MAG: polysaccharide deacetylase family protein [Methanomethylovorans sp.]|uniref:polysaccharide deacetylase family protein n=1 Tax=Methanomethylovorans sp. TaxID=2758717 RepID=UPI0035309C00
MINALSIDLEYWHTAELVRRFAPEDREDYVLDAVIPLLDLLDKYNTKATFFVLGSLAEKYPDLVKYIYEKGHEIGSHSYSHKTLYDLDKEKFDWEIKRTNNILKSITGESPIGFRAPTFSIDNSTKWAFDILIKNGFKYDSSVFPIKTNLYGVPNAPVSPYRPSKTDITLHDSSGLILEYPLSILKIGKNIPIAGGFYLRIFPTLFLKNAIKTVNKNRPVVLYIHPWETCAMTPVVPMPRYSKLITYYGIKSSLKKVENLLISFKFAPIREVLDL